MSEKLDIAKMEAAFTRAAHKAIHGSREERSGRFLAKQPSSAKPKSESARNAGKTRPK
jgi:hypothetical protein